MKALLRRVDDVLRGRAASQPWLLVVLCGMAYGAVMGSFAGRLGQMAYSAVKVPLLLLATLALSLPSYFILNTLLGVRGEFSKVLRAIVSAQAALTIILVALAPLTMLWYASSANYQAAILFNALMFGTASLGAQVVLARAYRPLVAIDPRHRMLLRVWLFLYSFVGIQMGWILRPFVGNPIAPLRFFRGGEWENAYVAVARMVLKALTQ
ncbi:hypothetical protein [Singulisphaera sp. PoT]|uniref:hypothetical protein n=1 Tax=Singulisphaera sp. PoT TaxID=3411797 RepID=UPI003BF51EC0